MEAICLSIVIPVYNEKINIRPTVENLVRVLSESTIENYEILFVDDDSPDGTAMEVDRIHAEYSQVRLIQHGFREGLGSATHFGYDSARGDIIIGMDADLSQPAQDVVTIYKKITQGDDLVIGSRFVRGGSQVNKPLIRDYGSRMINVVVRLIFRISVKDVTHTFRGFRRAILATIGSNLDDKGHPGFQIQFTYWCIRNGYQVSEVPTCFTERDRTRGQSKVSLIRTMFGLIRLVLTTIYKSLVNH